jgi:hypothetical protein
MHPADFNEVERAIREAMRKVCRRIGHDHGQWRYMTAVDGQRFKLRVCQTCGHGESSVNLEAT